MSRVRVPLSEGRLWISITCVTRRLVKCLRRRGRGLLLMRIWCRILFRCILRGIGRLRLFWTRRFLLGIWRRGYWGRSFVARFWLMRCSVMLVWVFPFSLSFALRFANIRLLICLFSTSLSSPRLMLFLAISLQKGVVFLPRQRG